MLWFLHMIYVFSQKLFAEIMHFIFPIYPILELEKKYSWLAPTYSWNIQLAHTPFPKKINTPSTTLRFIRFVAKISVLNPKLPADGQWPKERKESVTFFICSPLIDRTNKEQSSFCITSLIPFFLSFQLRYLIRLGPRSHVNCKIFPLLKDFLKSK